MGLINDILFAAKIEEFEKELKEAYQLGFRDGRLCPADLRPCEVDGQACLFHRFVDEDRALLKINCFTREEEQTYIRRRFDLSGVVPGGCSTEVIRVTYALVEYPDGSLGKVDPTKVCFTDREDSDRDG